MLHATLKFFFPAAYVGCNAAIAKRARNRGAVLMMLLRLRILLRDARIRSLHSVRAVIEADVWRAPETGRAFSSRLTNLPGFCPAVYPPSLRMVGLPLSDQRLATAKPEP